jgi:hypothetical protein
MTDTDFYVPDQFSYKLDATHAGATPESVKGLSLKGLIPDSWECIDCGFNTAPGLSTRVEVEAAFAADQNQIPQTYTCESEIYAVRNRVWSEAGMEPYGGCLCIGCLEKRIGRRLRPKDFPRNHPFNFPGVPGTLRLLKRRFGKHLKVLSN